MPLRGVQVLVAEDQFFIAEDIKTTVEAAGGVVIGPASSLEAAMTLAQRRRPDIATFNHQIKGLSTEPLARYLGELGVPILVLSSFGVDVPPWPLAGRAFLAKPFEGERLVNALRAIARSVG